MGAKWISISLGRRQVGETPVDFRFNTAESGLPRERRATRFIEEPACLLPIYHALAPTRSDPIGGDFSKKIGMGK
jgi:hypothetical protein